jgi:hypothetical protein
LTKTELEKIKRQVIRSNQRALSTKDKLREAVFQERKRCLQFMYSELSRELEEWDDEIVESIIRAVAHRIHSKLQKTGDYVSISEASIQ